MIDNMKVTKLYVYPIKGLRGIPLQSAQLGPQGLEHDRRFMLYRIAKEGKLKKMQLSEHAELSLFEQKLDGEQIIVRYVVPEHPLRPTEELPESNLEVPVSPDMTSLEVIEVDLHGSPAIAYRMGQQYDSWFSACFGFACILVYIGDGKRPVLGTTLPPKAPQSQTGGWFSKITSSVLGSSSQDEAWLTFTDVAPFMVATEASLRNVSARMSDGSQVDMCKFRPNIVVDGEDEWSEDYWAELTFKGEDRLLLTGNCGRCTSLNVDYDTGRPAAGEQGAVLKKLMKDRRVDKGVKYSPIFGRYGFLPPGETGFAISVGDEVAVAQRQEERSTWDWPGL
ncbi:hypothetical protein DL546_005271 [Coniochaeta pulveracea]|uniref:MOSC domain-containing protein n=1 Tax=Coniochaeta pulveracea TaxID=177199 RepID=A0A420YEP1_9PEZI|nr:hypothetical protein DL546_005271 [Coniochaeta pulveracea]